MLHSLYLPLFRQVGIVWLLIAGLTTVGNTQSMDIRFSGTHSLETFCTVQILSSYHTPVQTIVAAQLRVGQDIIVNVHFPYLVPPGLSAFNRHDLVNRQMVGAVRYDLLSMLDEKWKYINQPVTLCMRVEPVTDIGLPIVRCHDYTAPLEQPHLLYPFHEDTVVYEEHSLSFLWKAARCGDEEVRYDISVWNYQSDTTTMIAPELVLSADSLPATFYTLRDIREWFLPNQTYRWTVNAVCTNLTLPAYEEWLFHMSEDQMSDFFAQVKSTPDGGMYQVTDGLLRFVYSDRHGAQPLTATIRDAATNATIQELDGLIPLQGKNYFSIDVACLCSHSGAYLLTVGSSSQSLGFLLFSIDKDLLLNQCNQR